MKHSDNKYDQDGANKENGYHRDLYRNSREGKIFGVCAGFADYFDVPYWVARLVFISLVIFTFQFAIIGYIVAIFMMAKRPYSKNDSYETYQKSHSNRKNKVFNYAKPMSSRLQDIRDRIRNLDKQVDAMESYVTSKKFQTNNDINKL